jgi:hypothetical protein
MWTFALSSDDGSRLTFYFDRHVVDNDGLHGPRTRTGSIALAAGWHYFELPWFNKTGGAWLDLRYGMDGEPLSAIPAADFGRPARDPEHPL